MLWIAGVRYRPSAQECPDVWCAESAEGGDAGRVLAELADGGDGRLALGVVGGDLDVSLRDDLLGAAVGLSEDRVGFGAGGFAQGCGRCVGGVVVGEGLGELGFAFGEAGVVCCFGVAGHAQGLSAGSGVSFRHVFY